MGQQMQKEESCPQLTEYRALQSIRAEHCDECFVKGPDDSFALSAVSASDGIEQVKAECKKLPLLHCFDMNRLKF